MFLNISSRLAGIAAVTIATLALSSCSSVDPGFDAYDRQAQVNPNADAIVGLWQRKLDETFGMFGEETMKHRDSVLFRRDGTGVLKAVASSTYDNFSTEGPPVTFKWAYTGGGYWKITFDIDPSLTMRFRISGDRLLGYSERGGFTSRNMYSRATAE